MEAIDTQKIKKDIAYRYGCQSWDEVLIFFRKKDPDFPLDFMKEIEDEVISEVAKQVAERQREMCNKKAKIKIVAHYEKLPKETKSLPFTSRLGSSWKCYIDQKSILNAPIPEII